MQTDLVVKAQAGDQQAFATLAQASWARLYQVALRIVRDEMLAEDATQVAVVTMWRKLRQLRDPARFEAWSYRLLVNACHSEGRRSRRRQAEVNGIDMPPTFAPDGYGAIIDRDQLERGFRALSVDHRAVLVMHHYLDMPVEAIADALDIPSGTVKSRLHRAIQKLRLTMHVDVPSAPTTTPQEAAR